MWQITKGYSFRVIYTGGGYNEWRNSGLGHIEYRDSKHVINIDIGSLAVEPFFVVYTADLEDAIKPVLLPRLQTWLKRSRRNWEVR